LIPNGNQDHFLKQPRAIVVTQQKHLTIYDKHITTNVNNEISNLKIIPAFETKHSFMVFPEDMNYAGTLFGGKVLAEMDLTALKAARRILYGTACNGAVTASLNKVDFKRPAHLGDIIELNAHICKLGRTSIEIYVHVSKENHLGEVEEICSATFVFVSLNEGVPHPHNCMLAANQKPNLN
jgi:acyl-CoA hydrolase